MDIVYEKKTDKNLNQAIEALKESLAKKSFGVLWEMNFKEVFKEKGLEYEDDFVVLEVCNPKEAKNILEKNIHAGYILPCKMVVRTKDNQTYIGLTNPEALMGLFDEPDLNIVAKRIEATLKESIGLAI